MKEYVQYVSRNFLKYQSYIRMHSPVLVNCYNKLYRSPHYLEGLYSNTHLYEVKFKIIIIVSILQMILKYSSFNKLKPIFFLKVGNSISYVRIVVSQNGVDVRSISHGIKLRRSEL